MSKVTSIDTPVRFPSDDLASSNRRRKRALANAGSTRGTTIDLMANINYYREHGKLPESAEQQRRKRSS